MKTITPIHSPLDKVDRAVERSRTTGKPHVYRTGGLWGWTVYEPPEASVIETMALHCCLLNNPEAQQNRTRQEL